MRSTVNDSINFFLVDKMGNLSIYLIALVLVVAVSSKPQQFHEARREYQYERSYSANGQHSGAGYGYG